MSKELAADDLTLPIKRTEGETLEDRLTANAYHNILPARYLRKDADGELVEQQEELFERVAKNVALAETVYEADNQDVEITVTPAQIKPDHPRRDELAEEVFGTGATVDDDAETVLNEYNVNKFAYETVVPELPEGVRDHVEETATQFQEQMERLGFMPNSPTLMNAGDELQQLSACIAGHAPVYTRDGLKRMDQIEPGDEVLTHNGRFKQVVDHWSNGEQSTVEMRRGINRGSCFDTQLTPDHEVYTEDGEWVRADEVDDPADPVFPGDVAFPETIELEQYTDRLNKEKEVAVDGGQVKLQNAADPRTPEFDQQNNHPAARIHNDETLGWLFGLYLAEGDVYGSDLRFTIGTEETQLRERLIDSLEQTFDIPVSISESSHGKWVQIRVSSSFVADLFATVLGVGGDKKRIPEWVGQADESYKQALLDGLLDGDGTELDTAHRLVLANPTLVYETTLLARSLGYDAVFKLEKERDISSGPTSECYISTAGNPRLSNVARREAETTEVYDMEVADDHSFVVGDFVVHNCFVDSPEDDIDDIHQTAKEAASVFQCLTAETKVSLAGKGITSISDVEPGDRIVQRDGDDHRSQRVTETHAYHDSPVRRVVTEAGIELTGTPNHELLVNDEWTRIDEIRSGDTLSVRLGWIDAEREAPDLRTVAGGAQWSEQRTVSNDEILELYADGLSDYEIADRLDSSASTIQRRRSLELGLDPNGDGGRSGGAVGFDEDRFDALYTDEKSDGEIAGELGVSTRSVARYRERNGLEANCEAVKTVTQPSELSADLAELLGLWIGDGSKHEDGIRFHLNREETLEHADRLCRELFDVSLDWRWDEGCYEAVIHSHEIKRWWLANFGDAKPDAVDASVPDAVWEADRETIGAFLRGLFSTDGSLQKDAYPRLWSSSEALITGVQQLLVGVGIPAIDWEYDTDEREYYNVGPTGEQGLERFVDVVGFVDSRSETMAETIETIDSNGPSVGTVRGSTWAVPVETVEDAGTDTVYDVTVADNHEYVASSVVSHNSGGGMGYAFWRLRPYGDAVGSTGGIASGPITFMRTYDQLCETIAQGGARRGAQMGVMRVSHPDVIQFIHAKNKDVSLANTLRLNDPDDFTHTSFAEALEEARDLIDDEGRVPEHLRNAVEGHLSNFNISVGITDRFMEAVKNDEEYTFTNPRTGEPHVATAETKELYDMFGLGEHVEVGEVLSVPASLLWEHIVEGAHENGEPGVIYLERVNKKHSFDVEEHPDHRILATNPCVTGDSLISTENGLVKAEELYEQGVAREIVVDGRLSEDRVKEASSVYKTGEKDVYELTTQEGYELRLTADHRVMTDDGWTEAQDLEPGNSVHIQNRKGEFGQHGSAEEGRVLGWLVGDGHLKDGEERAVLNFYDEDAEISDQFADDVNQIVREPTGNANYEIGANSITRSDDYRGAQAVEQRIRSTRLYEYAAEAGLAENKLQVPDAVMRGSEEMARGYLQALFSADGSVQGNVEKGVSIRLASTDQGLLTDVQRLLLNFGIASKVYEDRKEGGVTELPNGQGGSAEYETDGFHELIVVKDNLVRFQEEIGFLLDYKNEALDQRLSEYARGPYSEQFVATVESIEYDGNETVYDLTEPETHSFVANGLVTHNCGEQPLEEYEACNLGHINLSTLAAQDAPDWRVWSENHADEYDTQEAALGAFLEEAIDWEAFDERIELGTRFLENVVTMSDFPVDEIEETVREMRKIGLGIMGLAQLYVQLGLEYGSEPANEIARQLMMHINHESKWASHELAQERGTFGEWEKSKYADPTEYAEWFEHHTGLDAEEWEDGFPIRNHNTTTIAPTGCVEENSLVSTDEGLLPIKDLDETTAEFEQWDEIEVGVSTDGGTKAATAVYDNGFADVRQIETEGGFAVASTPNHRFRTLSEDGEYVWKEADEFESGDTILLQRDTFDGGKRARLDTTERENYYRNTDDDLVLPERMTPELAEFLGYFVGDGYVHEGVGVKLVVESDAEELDAYLRELGQSLFGVSPTVEDRETRHILTFGGRHLPRYFEDNGWTKDDGNEGEGAASAFVPPEVLQGDEPIAKAFLRGLFEADGTASRKIELSTVSDTLASQVQTLLLSLGCVFVRESMRMDEREDHYGDRPRHTLRGANKREDKRFLETVGFITKSTEFELTAQSYKNDVYPPAVVEPIRAVDGYEDVPTDIKKRVNQSPINGSVSRKLVSDVERETGQTVTVDGRTLVDFYAATVDSVTERKAYTKDISVPSNNTYIANGFLTHNTTSMVGNTTGGCEPIYNVAYYKNVSDDVQGDEMLVEFDDYFLRVLEDNDIDVDAVKEEAQEQMANNEFDGVDGLTTVPDAIGELFVTTGALSAKQHASVQTACQQGVDSAISKCLEAGTLVQTDSGVRRIESFAEEKPDAGEFVDVEENVTIDGVPVESQYYAGEKEATRVRVDNGTEIVGATESHKVLTPDGWTVIGDLEEGDYVIGRQTESHGEGNREIRFSRGTDLVADGGGTLAAGGSEPSVHEKPVTLPSTMSPKLARFLGMYAADGSAIDARYSIEISTASERVRDEASALFEELFGREPHVETDTRHGEQRDTVYGVHLNSKPVWEFVRALCSAGSYDKQVPREILQGSPEEKLAFINGVTLDGYVSSQSLVVYGGMSADLAEGVAELLRSFGVPKIYVGRKWVDESDAYAYQVHVTNDAQELVTPIEPHKRVDRFDQRYRVYVPRDQVDKTEFDSRSSAYYAARNFEYRDRNYMFNTTAEDLGMPDRPPLYEVTEVEDVGTREMYDIELAGPHEYVVGGIVSHNTVNAPNDSTVEDAKEVFEYIYDHGGKGVTYYRDGTRSKQVLTTRAQNTEFADMDEGELVAQIEEVFGGIEGFLEHEDVQAALDEQVEELLASADGEREFAQKQSRPDVLHGITQRIDTGYGKLYVNINEDPSRERPFELFANIGNSGGFTASFTEALAKTISTALRSGVDPNEIADELQGIRSPKVAWDKGEQIQSIPDAIGTAMRRYLDGDVERAYPQQQTLEETAEEAEEDDAAEAEPETDGGGVSASQGSESSAERDQQSIIEAGESPECPDCGSLSLYYSEGCKTCESCGWSEC